MLKFSRRTLVHTAAWAGVSGASLSTDGATTAPAVPSKKRIRKAILDALLPPSWSPADRFMLAADLGFEGIEADPPEDGGTVAAMRAAADRAGLRIHSAMNKAGNLAYPLSSEDPQVAEKGLELLLRSLRVAAAWKADCVLLVPAQVTPSVRYQQAWERSQQMLRRALSAAHETGVTIAIENVGNRFLLSPLEFARYIDSFADPLVKAYFDVGNSFMLWGYPQDWLATLGRRIVRIHLKDCKFAEKKFVPLGDGDVDWAAVRQAMIDIGYSGYVTVEPNYALPDLEQDTRKVLADLSRRMDAVMRGLP